MLNFLKKRRAFKEKTHTYYMAAQTQARLPVFYEDYNVPDTPYGRFDMIALHCYLLMRRLNKNGEAKQSQAIFDRMFKILALGMREMGVGDLSVPKKMKKFMHDFNGRATQYEKLLEAGDDAAMIEALRRNVYGTADEVAEGDVKKMLTYIKANMDLEEDVFIMPEQMTQTKEAA